MLSNTFNQDYAIAEKKNFFEQTAFEDFEEQKRLLIIQHESNMLKHKRKEMAIRVKKKINFWFWGN